MSHLDVFAEICKGGRSTVGSVGWISESKTRTPSGAETRRLHIQALNFGAGLTHVPEKA